MNKLVKRLFEKTVIITSYFDSGLCFEDEIGCGDYVICIDGGYDIACENNITPDLLMGDFDSIRGGLPSDTGVMPSDIEIIRFRPEKDYTDLELALKKSAELNTGNVLILGGIGGRLDHTMANIQLLSHYADKFDSLVMKDGRNKCFVLNSRQKKGTVLPVEQDSYISLFSLSGQCTGVTISNVKYPLTDHTLSRDFPLGVSNEFKEKDAALSVKDGTLLVVISKKQPGL